MFVAPSRGPFLLWTLAIQLVLCGVCAADGTDECTLLYKSTKQQDDIKRLDSLLHKNFTVDHKIEEDSYTYVFKLCSDAGAIPKAGLIQINKKEKDQKPTVIGMYNATQVIGGTDWVMLIYQNGDAYDGHCNREKRKANIMITCNRKMEAGELAVVLEDRERAKDCLYLFELESSGVCPVIESKLSTGTILLIIGICLMAVYLIGGFLYQRLIVGAKGKDQFPNYPFWVDFGNLTADGCDFVCRSQSRDESPAYRAAPTQPIDEQPEERDDHLLPM
ncbi:cation-dependent mannose-6-phosphate receptor [Betta splendens]|uniref:Cation-dependent mannose-6-phosphate receptor n=1 Tax=Betta splendens TaxID=158456 RepID=A0A6P7KTL1_BETSP|nr:cation-dependent mannose-6-phosphate receptor [Betta splendens]XP_028984899.1 cation-dependent mannose-6-phosphate receptor [Betta splendens]XP_028984900.1 cation-dependent mannose-6-phosphate receptor [Betta splendens]